MGGGNISDDGNSGDGEECWGSKFFKVGGNAAATSALIDGLYALLISSSSDNNNSELPSVFKSRAPRVTKEASEDQDPWSLSEYPDPPLDDDGDDGWSFQPHGWDDSDENSSFQPDGWVVDGDEGRSSPPHSWDDGHEAWNFQPDGWDDGDEGQSSQPHGWDNGDEVWNSITLGFDGWADVSFQPHDGDDGDEDCALGWDGWDDGSFQPDIWDDGDEGWSSPPHGWDDGSFQPDILDDGDEGWSFPPHGWIKCNVDGSTLRNKASGCGGVFRDSSGTWLYGFAKSFDHRCTSSTAELKAISTALDIAWDRGYRKLILETDSLSASKLINKKNGASARRSYERELVKGIKTKKNRTWQVEIVHCNRKNNRVADWLAYFSHGLPVGGQIEFLKLPDEYQWCHKLMLEDTRVAKTKGMKSFLFS